MKPNLCNASPQGIGHAGEYGKIGFCRCGRFVSHEADSPCKVLDMTNEKDYLPIPDDCQCNESNCPCGEFLSHSVFDSCTAKISSKDISIVTDIFSKEEIEILYENIKANKSESTDEYGRVRYALMSNSVSQKIFDKLHNVIKKVTDLPLQISNVTYVEYNLLYGKPNLPAHVDGDSTELILNIQLESNTDWALGLNFETYILKDNSALVFNPNKNIHWRVHKEFKDGEYVRMLFVRFSNSEKPSDYSYLPDHPDNEMFKEVREFRDSLRGF